MNNSITFASIRLGKTSVAAIKHLNTQPQGLVVPFTIEVVCTQVPQEFDKGVYVFVWLGSDNSKGMPTDWKQGYKAFGIVESVAHGERYNDESTTIVKILYVFPDAVNRLDFLKFAPEAYYYCSALPIIGLDDHSNQTIRLILTDGERGNISSMLYALRTITDSFYSSLIQIDSRLQSFFDFVPPSKTMLLNKSISSHQMIFYGAPGTGKSHSIKKRLEGVAKENIIRTTFHPDSDYSTFVGAYKPTMRERYRYEANQRVRYPEDDGLAKTRKGEPIVERVIEYGFVPQAFVNAYLRAYQTDENVYLVIEEINRGNCAQIFGDLFQLLDRDEEGKSEYTIKADSDLRSFLEKELGKDSEGIQDGELCLPPNLYIWATMNTSDQSLFPIDSAFKRRWDWEYVPISYGNTDWKINIGGNLYSWVDFQREVNNRIYDATQSEDKKLGDYFVKAVDGVIGKDALLNKVLFYLWNDVCKDGEGDIFKIRTNGEDKDVAFSELYGADGTEKLRMMMDYLKIKAESDNDNDIEE